MTPTRVAGIAHRTCVARTYRTRKRFGRIYETVVLDSRRLLVGEEPELGIVCPGCGWRIYPGGRHLRRRAVLLGDVPQTRPASPPPR